MSKLAKQINAIFEGKVTASRSMKYVNVTKSVNNCTFTGPNLPTMLMLCTEPY